MMMTGSGELPEKEGNVKAFAAGATGLVVLMKSGNVYGIGDQYFSGTGGTVTTWRYLAREVTDIWTTTTAVLMRTLDGRWLFMGFNQYFNTGFGTTLLTPRDVTVDMPIPADLTIKQVSLGYRNVAVVFTNGQYAMCGTNNGGGLGKGDTVALKTLTLRTDFTNVEKIDLDWYTSDTSYLLTKDGNVYVAGISGNGQNGTTSNNSNWLLQTPVSGTVVDIVAGNTGFFRIAFSGGAYQVYAQGRDVNRSLGVNTTTNVNVLSPTLVMSNIPSRPKLYMGHYSARIEHPDGRIYFTGSGTGNLQGTGVGFQQTYAVFTALPVTVPYGGEYFSIKGDYATSYYLEKGILYGVGKGILPGHGTSTLLSFMPLDTSELA